MELVRAVMRRMFRGTDAEDLPLWQQLAMALFIAALPIIGSING